MESGPSRLRTVAVKQRSDVLSSVCVHVLHQNGHLAKELDLVSHHVRTRLDELKRQEVSRLRMLFKAKLDSTNVQSEWAGRACGSGRPHADPCGAPQVQ